MHIKQAKNIRNILDRASSSMAIPKFKKIKISLLPVARYQTS